jgi:outer membrane protein assembly factor BamB
MLLHKYLHNYFGKKHYLLYFFLTLIAAIAISLFVFSSSSVLRSSAQSSSEDWPTAGANLQRTSNSPANVTTVSGVTWYRPIEAFISGSTQLITSGNKVYVATAKGLVVLDAENGNVVCRFDTELPIGTPTVDNGVVYFGGMDRRLYALNSTNCSRIWSFTAGAGFRGNPLVTGGRAYIGNNDGNFYAINTSNGTQAWAYTTGGPVMESAAYDNGILYFASTDMYGYALNAVSGGLVWRTPQKLPGERYVTWWPVVFGNYLVWSTSPPYKLNGNPGDQNITPTGIDYDAFFPNPTTSNPAGTVISSSDGSHGWPVGSRVMSTTTGPSANPYTLQSWVNTFPYRRVYAIVNKSNGTEPFYLPWLESGDNGDGQVHPPASDGSSLYINTLAQDAGIARSSVFAWKDSTTWMKQLSMSTYAADEPLIISIAGGRTYVNLCCDRIAVRQDDNSNQQFWTYGPSMMLDDILPSSGEQNSYDPMWAFYDGEAFLERLGGYYKGNINSRNGVINSHGMQNPLVPLAFNNGSGQRVERLFTHRSNAIIALGPSATKTYLPPVIINTNPDNTATTLSATEITQRLENEVSKMVNLYLANGTGGFLKPAYMQTSGLGATAGFTESNTNYFQAPADTLYTLSIAYPYLSSSLKTNVLSYLNAYWQKYFVTSRILQIGWNSGIDRANFNIPSEVQTRMSQIGDLTTTSPTATWQRTFYAAWKYAQLVPSQASSIYSTVRPMLVHPPPSGTNTSFDLVQNPAVYNEYIMGYQGFLNLYDMAGTNPDPTLRANVANTLSNLINTRINGFAKDHPWQGDADNPNGIVVNNYTRTLNCARNFMYISPELATAMRNSSQFAYINSALNEYLYVCPLWFMARDHNTFQEASTRPIYDVPALFQAKAYLAGESQANLSKWIDVPWMPGDLYYMQNLVAALQASGIPAPTPAFTPVPSLNSTPAPTSCIITSANWQPNQVTVGDTATLTVTVANPTACSGSNISVLIYEEDPLSFDDLLTTLTSSFNQATNQKTFTYQFTAQDYINGGSESGNESVYFTAQVQGQSISVRSAQISFFNTTTSTPTPTSSPGNTPTPTTTSTPVPGSLQINNITDNRSIYGGAIPRYEKYEISFNISGSVATNFNLPYDQSAPTGVPGNTGITVNVQFTQNNFQTISTIPAFYYQDFDYQIKSNRDWIAPRDVYSWKARFAPPQTGAWQYRIVATDASGSITSSLQNFSVTTSSNRGFIKISNVDSRYFEFQDGVPFIGLGYNAGMDWFGASPITSTNSILQRMGSSGVELNRIWLTQGAIFGTAWNPYYGLRGDYGGYIPRTGITPLSNKPTLRLTYGESGGNRNTGYFEACRFLGGFGSGTAIKRNTTYKFRVSYRGFNISGPRNTAFPNYGFVLKMQNPADGNWHTNCYDAGTNNSTGQVISPYGGNNSAFTMLEGEWSSGNNDYLPPFYMALENVINTSPLAGIYIESVEIKEKLTNGTLTGPNLANKPLIDQLQYFDQKNSYVVDKVIEQAKANGVYLKAVVLEKDEDLLATLDSAGTYGAASQVNFYGNYRNMTPSRWFQRAWWRYIQARWGYSTNIHSWELVNEGDPLSDRHYTLTDEFGKYIRQFTPNQHLVTTSFWHSLPATNFWRNTNYPNVDYADLHAYVSTLQTGEFNAGTSKDTEVQARCGTNNTCYRNALKDDAALFHSDISLQAKDRTLGKPLIRGEGGLDYPTIQNEDTNLARDTNGVWLHNLVWSQLDSGGMYDLYWWTDNIRRRPGPDGSTANGLHEIFFSAKDFLFGIPINNGSYVDIASVISNPSLIRVIGQKDIINKQAYAWIQNRKHIWCAVVGGVSTCPYSWDNSRLSGTVTVSGFTPGSNYPLEWWYFDNTGNLTRPAASTITANSSGNIILNLDTLPATVTDAGVKINIIFSNYPTLTPTPAIGTPCTITSVNWQPSQVTVGDTATLTVSIADPTACSGSNVDISIYEEDPFNPDDLLVTLTSAFNQSTNQITFTYQFTNQDYINGGNESGNESIYFIAQVNGQSDSIRSSQINFYDTVVGPTPTITITPTFPILTSTPIPTGTPLITITPFLTATPFTMTPTPTDDVSPTTDYDIFEHLSIDLMINVITRLVCYVGASAILLMVIMVIFYGTQFLSAGGNPSVVTQSRKSIIWWLVGALVIIGAYIILATIANFLGADMTIIPQACQL